MRTAFYTKRVYQSLSFSREPTVYSHFNGGQHQKPSRAAISLEGTLFGTPFVLSCTNNGTDCSGFVKRLMASIEGQLLLRMLLLI